MPQLVPIEVQEIVRCTILAIRRRGELLGPLAKYDKINNDLIAALGNGRGSPIIGRRHGSTSNWPCALINAGRFKSRCPC